MTNFRKILLIAFCAGVMLAPMSYAAGTGKRVALVIGNSAYKNVPVLPNTTNDARDVASSLERLGFDVQVASNADYNAMRRSLIEFGRKAEGAEMATVFFAGHGIEAGGENWLIPVDAELSSDRDVEQEAIGLKSIMRSVAGASRLGLVMLDACRNNPFAAKMTRSARTRAVARGLVRVEPSGSVLVAYAAKDGTTASDGSGRNSPFTTALLRHLETPGLEINFLFRNVRDDVIELTSHEQEPFVYGSLSRQSIFLNAPAGEGSPSIEPPGRSAEALAWSLVRESNDPAQLRRFLAEFPESARRVEAERLIAEAQRAPPPGAAAPSSRTCFTFNGQQVCN